MADQEHVELLRRSVKERNQWRQEHPKICPDLRGVNLTRASLRGADLTRANLTRARLGGANLTRTNFRGAYLTEADLNGADLSLPKARYAHGLHN